MSPSVDPLSLASERKLRGRHLERLAVVYVRQSTVHQVRHHQESTQRQYGLVEKAERLGWPRERVLVIDEDLGLSGASAERRLGFQRLLGELALDHVGLILGVEMSRLARSCRDWYQLLELCAVFGTLICDLDGLYDPSSYNDRLLLGLKGTMSEAELHILQQRMRQGALQKARRGELVSKVPIGYVRTAAGEVGLDPDEQVRSVVRLIFDQFERIGTVAGVLRHLVRHGVRMPVRADSGTDKGRLEWRRPGYPTLRNMITHPMYAGAYVYGRSCQRRGGRPQRRDRPRRLPPEQWQVLLRDRYPAYVSWERYERHVARLAENRSRLAARGPARRGRALLAGLVFCGRCGARMMTRYAGKASQPRYCCEAARTGYAAPRCQSLAARPLDDGVVRALLEALTPAALEVSLHVASDLRRQFEQARRQWRRKLERARHEADRARRQYDAVEPENRLVARTLEAAWEQRLRARRELAERYERYRRQRPRELTAGEREGIRRLATDLPGLWEAPGTADADRKEVLRQVVDRVVVRVEGRTERVEAEVRWAGGHRSVLRLSRPVARIEQLSTCEAVRERLREMKAAGLKAPAIAERLNRERFTGPEGRPFTGDRVRAWLSRTGLAVPRRIRRADARELGPDEWLIPELARRLGVPYRTIYSWMQRGRIEGRRIGGPNGRRVVTVGPERLAELEARPPETTAIGDPT